MDTYMNGLGGFYYVRVRVVMANCLEWLKAKRAEGEREGEGEGEEEQEDIATM